MYLKQNFKYRAIISLCGVFLFSLQSLAQQALSDNTVYDLKEVQSLFVQVIALLGVSLVAYLYINWRHNNQKRNSKRFAVKEHHDSKSLSDQLETLINHIPYPACIANEKQRIICANDAFNNIIELKENKYTTTWDKYLKIDIKKFDLNSSDELVALCEDGKKLKISIKPLLIKGVSKPLYTIVVENISLIHSQGEDDTQRRAYFKNILSQTNFPIIIAYPNGNIVEANIHAANLLKTTLPNLINSGLKQYLPKKERLEVLTNLELSNVDKINNTNLNILNSDNRVVPVEVNLLTIDYIGTKAYFIVFKDISDQLFNRQEILNSKEKAEESDRLKSSFLANMSHEVRTPLNSIMGFTELMSDENISHKERKEFHQIVKASSAELLALLNDIVEFSKIESGIIKIDKTELAPHQIINELTEYAQTHIGHNTNLKFVSQEPIGISEPPIVFSDSKRVKQILRHLIDNAIKFTYEGTISCSYQYRTDNSLEFIISDTGIGIPQTKIPNIFHKFRQANDENSRDFGGAGLGLSICKKLTKSLGGFLWVSSVEQEGSHFHFVLPNNYNEVTTGSFNKNCIYYTSNSTRIPGLSSTFNWLVLFNYTALLNVPKAHKIAAIIIDQELTAEEIDELLSIPQIKATTIILYNENESRVENSPIENNIGTRLSSIQEINNYLTKYCGRELS